MTALTAAAGATGSRSRPSLGRIGLVRRGAGTALVGDPKTGRGAAARISSARNRDRHRVGLFRISKRPTRSANSCFQNSGIGEATRFNHGTAPGEFGVGAFKPAVAAE